MSDEVLTYIVDYVFCSTPMHRGVLRNGAVTEIGF